MSVIQHIQTQLENMQEDVAAGFVAGIISDWILMQCSIQLRDIEIQGASAH